LKIETGWESAGYVLSIPDLHVLQIVMTVEIVHLYYKLILIKEK